MIEKAIKYATAKHAGQVRKYSGVPYINHPLQVAEYVKRDPVYGKDDLSIVIALLHDVVEDCAGPSDKEREIFYEDIRENFTWSVEISIFHLTNQYTKGRYPKYNREKRKRLERERLAHIMPISKAIKLYDRLANLKDTEDWMEMDVEFALLYARESYQLALVLANKENIQVSLKVFATIARILS